MQLWVNLPAQGQDAPPPGYQADHRRPTFPNVALAGGGQRARDRRRVRRRARAGAHVHADHDARRRSLRAGESCRSRSPPRYNALAVVAEGRVEAGSHRAGAGELVLFANDGERLELTATEDAHVIVLSGEPLGEPIVQYGPFVMNTVDEIEQAMRDVESGEVRARCRSNALN